MDREEWLARLEPEVRALVEKHGNVLETRIWEGINNDLRQMKDPPPLIWDFPLVIDETLPEGTAKVGYWKDGE